MTRHSKGANTRPFISNTERSKQAWGSVTERVGSESFLPFGYCCISLKPAKNALASPQGWIFDRDIVVEYLANERAHKKRRMEEQKLEYEKSVLNEKIYQSQESQRLWEESLSNVGNRKRRLNAQEAISSVQNPSSRTTEASNSVSKTLLKDDSTPRCPMSGEKLKYKELIPVNFESTTQNEADAGIYSCALTKKPITHQQAVLIKPSGIVVLESAFKQSIKDPENVRCPITGAPLGKSDIIRLQTAGTSFSSHNNVQVKIHKY
jgi:nitric oxide synthase-interacting protein